MLVETRAGLQQRKSNVLQEVHPSFFLPFVSLFSSLRIKAIWDSRKVRQSRTKPDQPLVGSVTLPLTLRLTGGPFTFKLIFQAPCHVRKGIPIRNGAHL